MEKKEFTAEEKMANLKFLREFSESKDFETIVKKCNNRREALEAQIDSAFEKGEIDNEPKYSLHDVEYQRKKFYAQVIEDVKGDHVGGSLFSADVKKDFDSAHKFGRVRIINEMGIPYSAKTFTELDMKRFSAHDNHFMVGRLGEMIGELAPREAIDDEVYGEDNED